MAIAASHFLFLVLHPPRSTLFPYTTLFRSGLASRSRLQQHLKHIRGFFGNDRALEVTPHRINAYMELRQRSEEHTSELQSRRDLVCRLLLEKKKSSEDQTLHRSGRHRRSA